MRLIKTNQRKQYFSAILIALFISIAAPVITAQTTQRKFKPGDQIPMGSKIYEIVECRIKPNTRMEECDYIVVHEDGSTSSIFTQSVFELRGYVQHNEAEKKRLDMINRRNQPKPEIGETTETVTPPSEIEDAEITVTAKQLYDDYSNNDEAAKRKYVGKTVRVTGAIVYTISQTRFSAKFNKIYSGSTIQCYVEDLEQIPTLNKGETLTLVGVPLGSQTSTGVIFEPCRVERKTANQTVKAEATKPPTKTAGNATNAKVAGTWYYTTIINADGSEQKLSNSESYLWLKDDGSYENRFGAVGQIGTYATGASRLTLNRESGDKKVYTMTMDGTTMTLKSGAGGYKLEKE